MWFCWVDIADTTCDRIDQEVCQVDTDGGTGDRMDPGVCQVDTDDRTGDRIDAEVPQVDTDDGTGDRIDPEVCQVDAGYGKGDRIDPGVYQVDRQTLNLPRMAGARRRQPISPPWLWKRIYPGGPFRPNDIPFTGEEKIIPPIARNPTSQDFFQ